MSWKCVLGPALMNLNYLPPVQIWITDSDHTLIFDFESVIHILTGTGGRLAGTYLQL